MDGSRQDQQLREEEAWERSTKKRETSVIRMRLMDGCDMGPHPQDVIDHVGTPLGDMLLMMQLDVNAGIAVVQLYEEINKSWWQRLLDLILRR